MNTAGSPTTDALTDLQETPAKQGNPRFADFVQLSKLRITLMVAITAFIGFGMALPSPNTLMHSDLATWITLFGTLLGSSLACMASSVLNQIYERDTDGLMERTKKRPLPAGRVTTMQATIYALVLCALGLLILAVMTNRLATLLTLLTVVSYVLVYTPLKRVTSLSTIVGAVPGALPPLIGYAAARDTLGTEGWLLFAILFLWQLPHFLAIAWLYREDYARAGFPMLPVVDPDGASTFRQILFGCAALLPLGLLPTALKISGMFYFFGAMVAGLIFLYYAAVLVLKQERTNARALFFASLIYLPVVYGLMLMDRL